MLSPLLHSHTDPNTGILFAPLFQNPIVLSVIAAVIYSSTGYAKNTARTPKDEKEPFDTAQFGATLLVGAGIGLVMGLSGMHPTEAIITEQLAGYAGIVSVVTMVLKALTGAVSGRSQ